MHINPLSIGCQILLDSTSTSTSNKPQQPTRPTTALCSHHQPVLPQLIDIGLLRPSGDFYGVFLKFSLLIATLLWAVDQAILELSDCSREDILIGVSLS